MRCAHCDADFMPKTVRRRVLPRQVPRRGLEAGAGRAGSPGQGVGHGLGEDSGCDARGSGVRRSFEQGQGGTAMAKRIPRTNFAEYWRVAEAIRRDLRASTGSPVAVRQAVLNLADLVAKALEEAAQVSEGLSMVVLAQHPDVTRGPRRAERATGATGRTARRRTRRGNEPGPGRGRAYGGVDSRPGAAGHPGRGVTRASGRGDDDAAGAHRR